MAFMTWTIDELALRAADTLAADRVAPPNGRVTGVPDRRLIRWYATIGLLDRPLRTGGRVARYGPRHLLQLVAIKRRQAQGRSLTEIQAELAGATDATLRRVAGPVGHIEAPDAPTAAGETAPARAIERGRFWAERPAAAAGQAPFPNAEVRYAVVLHPAVSLTVPARPGPDDLTAIHAAARPLLDLLAQRGLLDNPGGTHEPADRPHDRHRA
jgi:DNA-binding transcriptional MerR regulator